MSYDTTGRKKAKPAEQQALLPDKLREANVKIEGLLTKLQNNQRTLVHLKADIGVPEKDSQDLRDRINKQQNEMQKQGDDLESEIEAYGNISVPYRSQRQQTEKKEAYSKRLSEIVNKFNQERQEIQVKMQQHIDLVKRQHTLAHDDSTLSLGGQGEQSHGQLQMQQLDVEELKIQGETAYFEDVINQRQEDLDDVEKLMTDINYIAKDINQKVHEQRDDLVEIDHNAGEALDNAKEAEKNIEEAQEHQKSGGKCMYWTVGLVSIFALVIILIVVLKLV